MAGKKPRLPDRMVLKPAGDKPPVTVTAWPFVHDAHFEPRAESKHSPSEDRER